MLDEAHTQREAMQRDVRQISASYHPFDLTTGAPRSSDTVENELQAAFARMKELAEAAGLGKRREALLAKAARVVPWLVATIAWFHKRVAERVAALSLPAAVAAVVHTELIPGLYLLRVARRARVPEVRDRLRAQGHALVTNAREGLLRELPEALRRKAERVAVECAGLFVAASACVEGRNGHLRQSLNGLHRLLPGKLKALTVVHNFFITARTERPPPRDSSAPLTTTCSSCCARGSHRPPVPDHDACDPRSRRRPPDDGLGRVYDQGPRRRSRPRGVRGLRGTHRPARGY